MPFSTRSQSAPFTAARLEADGDEQGRKPGCPNPESDGSHGLYSLRTAPDTPHLTLVKPLGVVQPPVDPPWTDREAGMATAEYAIATLAAVAFAGLLAVILGGDEVRGMLVSLIRSALTLG